jgi:hypothetical protein
VNGDITVDGVAGDITASTVNGGTTVKDARRNLNLTTVNGTIKAEMESLGGRQKVSFSVVNGQMELTVPEDADAAFTVNTINGSISSEFPALQAKHEWPVGNNLHGRLGNGEGSVKVDAVNGTIRFLKGGPTERVITNASSTAGDAETAPAITAAQSWLKLIDTGKVSESWKQSSAIFQGMVTETKWQEQMDTYRKPLGDVVSRKLNSAEALTHAPGAPDGHYVTMIFETSFTAKNDVVETVSFYLEPDGQWRAAGYFIK